MVAAPTTTPITPSIDPSRLIDLLTSPDLSLREIADQLGVSLERLTLLIGGASNDESAPTVTAAAAACTTRARLAATALLPRVLRTLRHSLDEHESHIKANTATDAHHERARRACTLILRIANSRILPLGGGVAAAATEGASPSSRSSPPSAPSPARTAHRAPLRAAAATSASLSRFSTPPTDHQNAPSPTDAELLALLALLDADHPEILPHSPNAPVSPDSANTPNNAPDNTPPSSPTHLHTSSPAQLPIPSPLHLLTPSPAPSPHLRDPPYLPSGP